MPLARGVNQRRDVTNGVPSRYQKERLYHHFARTLPHTLLERLLEVRLGCLQMREAYFRAVTSVLLHGVRELGDDGVGPRVTTAVIDEHDGAFHEFNSEPTIGIRRRARLAAFARSGPRGHI